MAMKPLGKALVIFGLVGVAAFATLKSGVLDPKPEVAQRYQQPITAGTPQVQPAKPSIFGGAPVAFDSYARVQATRELKIGVQGNAAPFFNNGSGFNPDFLRLLARQPEFNGISVRTVDEVNTYEEVPQSLLKKAGNEPLVDIAIDGLTLQDGDVGGVTYTVPYVAGFGYALITNRTSSITSAASVGNKRLGILKGDPDVAAFARQAFPNAQFVELSDALVNGKRTWIEDAFKRGEVDAIVYDYPFAVSEIAGTSLQFAVSKLQGSDISYKIGVRATDNALLQNLNAAIARVVETEEYRGLLRTYFSSNKITTTRASANERSYTVAAGDTLSLIAERQMGDRRKYTIIEARNNLPNPNLISVGQVLVIPAQ